MIGQNHQQQPAGDVSGRANNPADGTVEFWIASVIRRFPQMHSCIVVFDGESCAYRWPVGNPSNANLVAAAQLARRSRSPVVTSEQSRTTIAFKVFDNDVVIGSVAMVFEPPVNDQAMIVAELEQSAYWLAALHRQIFGVEPIVPRDFAWLEALLANRPLEQRIAEACSALATLTEAQRVTIARYRRDGFKILGVSGEKTVLRRSPLGHRLQQAFVRALGTWNDPQRRTPLIEDHGRTITIALQDHGNRDQENLIGAIHFEKFAETRFDDAEIAGLRPLAVHLAAVLKLALQAERDPINWVSRGIGRMRQGFNWVGVAAACSLVLIALFPMTQRVGSPAYIEGEQQRTIVAPMHSYLEAVHVEAGEQVISGQLLAKFAIEDLLLEQLKWQSERARLQKEKRDAAARQERAKLRVLDAEIAQANAEIALVESKISRHELRAPVDGVIVSGDLSQHLGAPVERGEVLFEIVPNGAYQLALLIDEQDVRQLQPEMRGQLKLNAFPRQTIAFELNRITPVNEISPQGNHFLAYATLQDAPASLQPGMRGIAKTEVGSRAAIANWSESLRRWLRLKFWAWFG